MKTLAVGSFLLTLGAGAPAWAIPITLTFTAAGFNGGPEDPVSGSVDYNAASVTSGAITSINSINLTIAGHTYTVAELGTIDFDPDVVIGALAFGVGTVETNSDDFAIDFNPVTDTGIDFSYATPSTRAYATVSFSQFSVTADAVAATVPEPDSWVVLLSGIAGLGGLLAHRRRPT